MSTVSKTFDELQPGEIIIVPGEPKCRWPEFREDQEYTVEIKYEDETVKVKELGGLVLKMDKYKVKTENND
ncbi:MAG: hypothetical protein ACOCVA_00915 [Prolixibacteraceae bacterium]